MTFSTTVKVFSQTSLYSLISTFAAITLLGLPSCTKTIGSSFSDADVQKIIVGQSDKPAVIRALGKPYRQTTRADGSQKWTFIAPIKTTRP